MDKKSTSKSSLTTKYIILFAIFFLMANIALGLILHRQMTSIVQGMIRTNMQNISSTAADLIDGDVIGSMTEKDVGSAAYNEILRELTAFLNNADIEFIYAVRQTGPDKYVFTIDSDPVDPGQFGEEVLVTPALVSAGKGVAAVDAEAAEDRWGNFYTSYTPIFDSKGDVAGMVGVDFTSAWYDEQVKKNTIFVIVISMLFTLVGIAGFILLGVRVRRRFADLDKELSILSDDVEELTREILINAGYRDHVDEITQHRVADETQVEGDEIKTLSLRIHSMHEEMERYLEYMHAQVNTDALTGVGNTAAYKERKELLEEAIRGNTAAFTAVMFDINDLKLINDRYGHAGGDRAIRVTATAIADVYKKENTFRIGGDEFITIADQLSEDEVNRRAEHIQELLDEYNDARSADEPAVSISQGAATFDAGQDHAFGDVFVRADEQMYDLKDRYHQRDGRARDQHEN